MQRMRTTRRRRSRSPPRLARSMDPESKKRTSRSLGSLDDILVTLERLKQGPGFAHEAQQIKGVTKPPEVTWITRGEGVGEIPEPDVTIEGSRASRSREESGEDCREGASRGNAVQETSLLPPRPACHSSRVETRVLNASRVSRQTLRLWCDKMKDQLELIKIPTAQTTLDEASQCFRAPSQ